MVVEQGRAHSNSDTASDTVHESAQGSGNSHVLLLDRSLGSQHAGLQDQTDSKTDNQQETDLLAHTRVFVEQHAQTDTDRHHSGSQPDKDAVVTNNAHQGTRGNRRSNKTEDHGQQLETRGGGRRAQDDLEVDGAVENNSQEAHAGQEVDTKENGNGGVEEQSGGDDGLDRLGLDPHQDDNQKSSNTEEDNNDRRVPCVVDTAPGDGEQQADDSSNDQEGTPVIDAAQLLLEVLSLKGQVQEQEDRSDRDKTQRQIDEEAPAPGGLLDKDTSEQGTDDGRDTKDTPDDRLVLCTLLQFKDIGDDDEHNREKSRTTETLNGTEDDEHSHRLGTSCTG